VEEYERGIEILLEHGKHKSRFVRQFYLLRDMIWARVGKRTYKMHGSTPTGRSKSYAYYVTRAKPNGHRLHLRCHRVDAQIKPWLYEINVDPELLPEVRQVCHRQVTEQAHSGYESEIAGAKNKIARLRSEEARLGRLLITDQLSEEAYEQLRAEWKDKLRSAHDNLRNLERDIARYLEDLDVALLLMSQMSALFERFEDKAKHKLLQIMINRIIADPDGQIVDHELNKPFGYLNRLVSDNVVGDTSAKLNGKGGSSKVLFGVQIQNTRVQPDDVGLFLSELRFESPLQKSQAEELLGHETVPKRHR
jgi:hypothetical protein